MAPPPVLTCSPPNAEFLGRGQDDRGGRLVDLDHVELFDGDEAPTQKRKQIRNELQTALRQLMVGLHRSSAE